MGFSATIVSPAFIDSFATTKFPHSGVDRISIFLDVCLNVSCSPSLTCGTNYKCQSIDEHRKTIGNCLNLFRNFTFYLDNCWAWFDLIHVALSFVEHFTIAAEIFHQIQTNSRFGFISNNWNMYKWIQWTTISQTQSECIIKTWNVSQFNETIANGIYKTIELWNATKASNHAHITT